MDMIQVYFLFELTVAYLLCMSYLTHGRMYTSGSSRYHSSGVRRKEEPNNAEKYISSLWKSALERTGDESRNKMIKLTPNGGPGPTVLKIITNGESASTQPLSILSSGSDDDLFDFSSSTGKIMKIPDSALGPIQILKSPGKSASILVTTRRGNKSFSNRINKNSSNNNQHNLNNNNQATDTRRSYVGTFTGFLAESLCPLCRRLVNPRYRISCLLRYCYENPNISSGNPR